MCKAEKRQESRANVLFHCWLALVFEPDANYDRNAQGRRLNAFL